MPGGPSGARARCRAQPWPPLYRPAASRSPALHPPTPPHAHPAFPTPVCFFAHGVHELRTPTGGVLDAVGADPAAAPPPPAWPPASGTLVVECRSAPLPGAVPGGGGGPPLYFAGSPAPQPPGSAGGSGPLPTLVAAPHPLAGGAAGDWSGGLPYIVIGGGSPTAGAGGPVCGSGGSYEMSALGAAAAAGAPPEVLQSLIREASDRRAAADAAAARAAAAASEAAVLMHQLSVQGPGGGALQLPPAGGAGAGGGALAPGGEPGGGLVYAHASLPAGTYLLAAPPAAQPAAPQPQLVRFISAPPYLGPSCPGGAATPPPGAHLGAAGGGALVGAPSGAAPPIGWVVAHPVVTQGWS
jgi:hypothetical protein